MAQMRAGDWSCPSCGNHNYASRATCNKCQGPKMHTQQQAWQNPAQAVMGVYGAMKGGKGGAQGARAQPYAVAPAAPSGKPMKPGDWCCMGCGNHNFADKVFCNRCKMPGMMQGAGHQNFGAMAGQNFGGAQNGNGAMRPGDWKCYGCQNVNYASRDTCNRCAVSKSTFISKTGMRTGDWICPGCQNHNYASKEQCNKCGTQKSQEAVHTRNMKEGDWLCPSCQNHNYANKVVCNRCSGPKTGGAVPKPSAAAGGKGAWGKAGAYAA